MLAKIQALLKKNDASDGINDEYTLQLASAVLLLEVAKADFENDPEEQQKIKHILQHQFVLHADDLARLFEDAVTTGSEVVSLHSFVRTINTSCNDDDKAKLIEQMWQVAYADGRLDKYEDYTIRKIADWLYVPHHVFIRTKQHVRAQHV